MLHCKFITDTAGRQELVCVLFVCLCVCESLIAAQYQDCTFCNSCMGTSLPNNSVAVASCSSKHAQASMQSALVHIHVCPNSKIWPMHDPEMCCNSACHVNQITFTDVATMVVAQISLHDNASIRSTCIQRCNPFLMVSVHTLYILDARLR